MISNIPDNDYDSRDDNDFEEIHTPPFVRVDNALSPCDPDECLILETYEDEDGGNISLVRLDDESEMVTDGCMEYPTTIKEIREMCA